MNIIEQIKALDDSYWVNQYEGTTEGKLIVRMYPPDLKALAESHELLFRIVKTFKLGHAQLMDDVDEAIEQAEALCTRKV